MYTITFYSFKGGVGRTMALVNVAAHLAKMGRKVLLVDFDLEAPGLETYDRLRPGPLRPKRVLHRSTSRGGLLEIETWEPAQRPSHPGLVEFVTEYMRTDCAPDVREYVYSVEPIGKKGGQIWVMSAGRRDAEYQSALEAIDWVSLYRDHDGFLLFEDTKAQWEQEFKPDYVLIDSRTGHTDVEGICTRQLPDAVVMLFMPNEQNLVGVKDVGSRIRREATSGLKKQIRLHLVMSNVPDLDDEDRVLRRRLAEFEAEVDEQLSAVIHRHDSPMLFDQAIFVLDRPRSRLAREYRRLTRNLIAHNPADRDGALFFLVGCCEDLRRTASYDLTRAGALLSDPDRFLTDYGPAGAKPLNLILDEISGNFPDDADIQKQVDRCREAAQRLKERCEQTASASPRQ